MTGATTVTMFVTLAAGFIGRALLLAFSVAATQAPETDSPRTIDVKLSRYAFSPERIEVRVGEQVRLNVVSVDRAHGFRVKELGLDVRTPTRGRTVTVEVTPKEAGTFQIDCSEYCGSGHARMKAWLIVTPGT
jgi:cytochrome c oxidase subunit II